MTPEKITLEDYGLTNLHSFLNAQFDKPSVLQRTIGPKEQCLFYVPVLIHQARGSARAALVVKDEDLFFKLSIGSDSALIPCGHLSASER